MASRQVVFGSAMWLASCVVLQAQSAPGKLQQVTVLFEDTSRGVCSAPDSTTTYKTGSITIPINKPCNGATEVGQVAIQFPDTIPATLDKSGFSFTLTPQLATNITLSGHWTTPNANYHAYAEIGDVMGYKMCPDVSIPQKNLPTGDTSFSLTRPCTFTSLYPNKNSDGTWEMKFQSYVGLDVTRKDDGGLPIVIMTITWDYKFGVPAMDLSVNHFEVVQAVQDPDNNVPLIAGKSTVARVYVGIGATIPAPVTGVTGLLHGFRDDVELVGSPLKPVNRSIAAQLSPKPGLINDTLNFRLPPEWTAAGNLRLVAEVLPPDGANLLATAHNISSKTFAFRTPANLPSSLYVYYWSLCYQPPGAAAAVCPTANIARADTLLDKLYPWSDTGIQYLPWTIPQKTWRQPILTDADMSRLIASFRKFYDVMDQSVGGADQLAVWMPPLALTRVKPQPGQSPTYTLLGTSDPKWSENGLARVTYNADTSVESGLLDAAATLAHEIGHNFGLRHTNTPDSCGAGDSKSDWRYPNSTIQVAGLDPQTMEAKPSTKMDMMSYCSPPGSKIWISPFHFGQLVASQALVRPPAAAVTAVKQSTRSAAAATEYLIISGSAQRDGTAGTLDPGYRITSSTPGPPPDPAGNHCLRFTGAGGDTTDYCFTLAFQLEQLEDPIDQESFSLKVPYVAGAVRVSLLRDGNELAALTPSANAPNLTILTPQPGDTWTGTQTITWSAFDPDGNALIYSALYSADGGNSWLPVDLDLTDTQYSFDTADIQAGSQIYFRVLASSSVNTTSATVGPITILSAARIQVAPASLDFGAVLAAKTSDQELLIVNRGSAPLNVSSISIDKPAFAVVAPARPFTIAPGARQTVTVRFTAGSAPGAQSATLSIVSDDRDGATPAVALTAFVATTLNPQILVTPASLDFGSVPAKTTKDLALTVSNSGGAPLTVSAITSSNPQFSASAPATPFTLAPGAQQLVTVRFTANAGTQTGSLTIASDDPARAAAAVSVTGAGPQTNPIPGPAPSVLFSDSFRRADADRCSLGAADLALGGAGSYYYVPMFGVSNPVGANIVGGALQNNGKGYGGVEFVPAANACSSYSRASNIGQDVDIQLEVLVPTDAAGHITDAGPFFRARAANRGDGYFGGDNAGYWVALYSTGEVRVKNLNTAVVLAASAIPAAFDSTVTHKLEISARGATLQVAVDGQLAVFGATTSVSIPATAGSNDGAAGIAFGAELSSSLIGGQRAANLVVSVYR